MILPETAADKHKDALRFLRVSVLENSTHTDEEAIHVRMKIDLVSMPSVSV